MAVKSSLHGLLYTNTVLSTIGWQPFIDHLHHILSPLNVHLTGPAPAFVGSFWEAIGWTSFVDHQVLSPLNVHLTGPSPAFVVERVFGRHTGTGVGAAASWLPSTGRVTCLGAAASFCCWTVSRFNLSWRVGFILMQNCATQFQCNKRITFIRSN